MQDGENIRKTETLNIDMIGFISILNLLVISMKCPTTCPYMPGV